MASPDRPAATSVGPSGGTSNERDGSVAATRQESVARRKIRQAVEAKGYSLVELTWEPWGQAAEKEGIPGGWWGRIEPDPSPPGSSGLDWIGGLSWQECVSFVEEFVPSRVAEERKRDVLRSLAGIVAGPLGRVAP